MTKATVWLGLAVVASMASPAPARANKLLVHLPSVPLESSSRLANAVTALRDYVSADAPHLAMEVEIFRRWEDAYAFYQADPSAVTAVLAEPSFLLDLAADDGFVPSWRFYRSGSETYRRLLVVRSDLPELDALSDLRGRSLQFVKTTGDQNTAFLERAVFVGEVAPEDWFGSLVPVPDDFSAVAAVLHGQVDAALVAEYNPLLGSELGKKLREVYSSPPLSLPVLALRSSLPREQRTRLDDALRRIGESSDGVNVLSELGLDGLRPVANGSGRFDREALLRMPALPRKTLEIALPSGLPVSVERVAPLEPADLTFSLAIELPETAPVTDLEEQDEGKKPR